MDQRDSLYEQTKGLSGMILKNKLYKILSPLCLHDSYKQHSYDLMKQVLLNELKEKGLYGQNDIENQNISCEHIWPQSFFNKEYPMKSDMNHCFFTHKMLNSHRNTYKFGEINEDNAILLDAYGKKTDRRMQNCLYNKKCNLEDLFEPIDVSKGNIARAVAYFHTMYPSYDLNKVMDIDTMINWHKMDPVDTNEELRTNIIYKHQGNYNPYIVYPELLERVFLFMNKSEYYCSLEERVDNLEMELYQLKEFIRNHFL